MACLQFLKRIGLTGCWSAFPLQEKTRCLGNPYRGTYKIYRFYAHDESLTEKEAEWTGEIPDPGQTLALIEINLRHFREGSLSPAALEKIDRILERFSGMGLDIILRFLYDWEGLGAFFEPNDMDTIRRHMTELSPLMRKWSRHLLIVQGLFTGSWGEMHNTRYAEPRQMALLAQTLAEATDGETFLAVRCPSYWRSIFRSWDPIQPKEAYNGTIKARFGLFNDAFLSSDTDMGTYGSAFVNTAEDITDKFIRRDEIRFQQRLCLYAPLGGEVINASHMNDIRPALDEMKALRVTYLNSLYDQQVLDKWRRSPSPAGQAWKDATGYDYLTEHLGYRFEVVTSRVTRLGNSRTRFSADIEIKNTGFAPCYRRFDTELVLAPAQDGEPLCVPIDTDVRFWMPDTVTPLHAELDLSDRPGVRYTVGLRLRCCLTGMEITIANTRETETWMTNPLGELQV